MCPRGQAIIADGDGGFEGDNHCLGILDAAGKGMTPQEKYNLYLKKAVVTKYLSPPAPQKLIASLPIAWDELPLELKEQVFPKGKPEANQAFAGDVMQLVRSMPLRRITILCKEFSPLASSSNAETVSTPMSVDAICKVVEACSVECSRVVPACCFLIASVAHDGISNSPMGGCPLWKMDVWKIRDLRGFQRQEEAAALEGQKLPEITVERQVQDLQAQATVWLVRF